MDDELQEAFRGATLGAVPRVSIRLLRGPQFAPERRTQGSVGYDLRAALEAPTRLNPGDIAKIPVGFALALPLGIEAQVRPRSGLAWEGLEAILGTIDCDYRGEVCVLLANRGRCSKVIHPEDRIAQMVLARVPQVVWSEVEALGATARGNGGFGSTGRG